MFKFLITLGLLLLAAFGIMYSVVLMFPPVPIVRTDSTEKVLETLPTPEKLKVEYEIELVDQTTVKIYSLLSNKLYTTTHDSIQYYIEIDNL